jgi:hypothetical protein
MINGVQLDLLGIEERGVLILGFHEWAESNYEKGKRD